MPGEMGHIHVSSHPLVEDKLNRMRDKKRSTSECRQLLHEVGVLLAYEITSTFPSSLSWIEKSIETPVSTKSDGRLLYGRPPVIVPVLRSGLVMAEGLNLVIPWAHFGFVGLHRDEDSYRPIEYVVKIPDPENRLFIVVDPLIATGNSAAYTIEILRSSNVKHENIKLMCLLASRQGLNHLTHLYPDIDIYVGCIDGDGTDNLGLNERKMITPGLGDIGDRIFGTISLLDDAPQEVIEKIE